MALLLNLFETLAPFLLVVTLIVTIHELGHFLTARAFGVAIDRFSIGFGPTLFSWRDRGGVEWRLAALPLGGYVRFGGDTNAASVPDRQDLAAMRREIVAREGPGAERRYLPFKPLWQRALIVAAGPAANFLLAIVLFAVFVGVFGTPATPPVVANVVPGGAAAAAGFQPGDRFLTADGHRLDTFEDVQFFVQYRAGDPIAFTVQRGPQVVRLVATPAAAAEQSPFGGTQAVGRLGLEARGGVYRHPGPLEALAMGVTRTWQVTGTTVYYLGRIVTGHVAANQLHSFVGIASASGTMTRQAIDQAHALKVNWAVAVAFSLIQLAALMSVSVGLLNLLPIPVLDGGHLLFYAYEGVVRRPLDAGLQAAGYRVGLALLLGLMLFATWNDLQRLRLFHVFGS